MSKTNYSAILANAVAAKELSERDLKKVLSAMNNDRGSVDWSPVYDAYGVKLSEALALKGFKWLWNLWKSPTGKVRKNSPFGFRETRTLETFESIYLIDYYDLGRWSHYYVPIYRVEGSEGCFDYLVKDHTAYIVG